MLHVVELRGGDERRLVLDPGIAIDPLQTGATAELPTPDPRLLSDWSCRSSPSRRRLPAYGLLAAPAAWRGAGNAG